MKYGIAILTLNEIEGLKYLIEKIPFSFFDEAFVVDGGSTDGTIEFLKEHQIPIVLQKKKGRGEAFKVAFQESKSDILIFFSPDGNEDPSDLTKIKNEFVKDENLAIVIASRMMKDAKNEEDDQILRWRKWANNAFNFLANLFFNRHMFTNYITDSINGFRGIKRQAFEKLKIDASGYTIEYQSTIRALKTKMKIKEIPTREEKGSVVNPTPNQFQPELDSSNVSLEKY